MKISLVLIVTTLLAPLTSSAAPVLNDACLQSIESLVNTAAQKMSGNNTAGVLIDSLNDQSTLVGNDSQGRPEYKVETGKIFIDDGYLSGDGATLLVVPTKISCDILKLTLAVGE
jgi:hypothetical protein